MMKKFLAAALIASSLFTTSPVNAEVKTYEGIGEYVMGERDTLETAKQGAKDKALRNALERAGVLIQAFARTQDSELVEDMITSQTGAILKVVEVTVKANIETDDVGKWLEKSARERSTIVTQNKQLQQAVADQDATINKLKAQIRRLTAEGKLSGKREREKISAEIAAEDKIFQSNQKLADCRKLYYDGDYRGVVKLCDEAIKLNANNAQAYALRGAIYKELQNYDAAISDLSKAIELQPDYAAAYNDRGTVYQAQQNFSQAFSDYDKGVKLDPNEPAGYVNRGMMYLVTSKFNEAVADANKAIELQNNFAAAYALRAGAYLEIGGVEAETILADLNRAIELDPKLAFAYYCRGIFWRAVGDPAKAQADFDKVTEISGADITPLIGN